MYLHSCCTPAALLLHSCCTPAALLLRSYAYATREYVEFVVGLRASLREVEHNQAGTGVPVRFGVQASLKADPQTDAW